MYFIIKSPPENDPTIKVILRIENKTAICQADAPPVDSFAVEFPAQLFDNVYLHAFQNGKRHRVDIFCGKVEMIGPDETGRLMMNYTDQQIEDRKQLLYWLAKNVYIPDMARMGIAGEQQVISLNQQLDQLNTDTEIKEFTISQLYYDL